MNERWSAIDGGSPVLELWPETEADARLSAVERAVLKETLADAVRRFNDLRHQVELARCEYREFTGYGAHVHLVVPPSAPEVKIPNGGTGGACLNWTSSEKADLHTVAFFSDGKLSMLEIFPSDGENWSVTACREVLSATIASVAIKDGRS